ncbi:MAG: hypothetical protein HFJ36_02450 [Clostridia bacterium]|nr:hypothetical protein [Clostridia bacterium]
MPEKNQFTINAFEYPYINDLLMIADILISDYSSVVWDYSILEKPIFCFAYDYDTYISKRGTYEDLNEIFFGGITKTQEELIDRIKNMNETEYVEHTKKIKKKYIIEEQNATKKVVEIIFKEKDNVRTN